ncbi:MAG: glycoside hydrolase family 3 C-terminal domain-containing protein, partial [Clostridiales bacterium]|nr:glycoside hydrolase family 3 C-terminal domain-containing protein [Clostridiales bacterium]
MTRWIRHLYQPGLPLGEDGRRVTGSPEHIELSRRGATEGMVLLKNEDKTLPVKNGAKVALFGKGTVDYVKGGGGSGDVTVKYVRNFYEGMKIKEAEGKVSIYRDLIKFYEEDIKSQYEAGRDPGMTVEPVIPAELLDGAREFADTAIITLCRYSGEGWDRNTSSENIDYLWEGERRLAE